MRKLLVPVVLLFSFAACSSSPEAQLSQWKYKQTNIPKLKTRWPSFAPLLDAQLKEATKAWDAATKLSDKKAKVEKMKAAHAQLDVVYAKLAEVQSKSEALQKKVSKYSSKLIPKSQSQSRKDILGFARSTLTLVDQGMRAAKPNGPGDVEAIIRPLVSKLISADKSVSRGLKNASPSKKKRKKKK
jgi:hypothetical protein